MTIKPEDIVTLIELFDASQWNELHVELDGLHLFLSTDPDARLASTPAPQGSSLATAPATAAPPTIPAAMSSPAPAAAERPVPANWVAVTAPNLGTFYRSPKPGAAPFVDVGQAVEAASEICLLEVMKLFTAVQAGTRGIVRRICVTDAEMVEFGATLFFIEPA